MLVGALGAAFAANLACAGVAVWQLSFGSDEAWSLSSALAVTRSGDSDQAIPVVLTSGGLYAAAHAGLGAVGVRALAAHRLLSLAALAASLALVAHFTAHRTGSRIAACLAAGALLATPGALVFGATALAEPIASLLFIALFVFVARDPTPPRLGRVLATGALAGLLAATRATALPMWLALTPWLIGAGTWRAALTRLVGFASAATGVLALAHFAYLAASSPEAVPKLGDLLVALGFVGDSSSLAPRAFLDPGPTLHRFAIAHSEAALPLLALITIGSLWLAQRERGAGTLGSAARLLVGFGWLGWSVWLVFSPLPFLRYLWPALPAFWLAGGLLLAATFAATREPWLRVLCLATVVAALGAQLATSLHSFARGSSTRLAEHWSAAPDMGMFFPASVRKSEQAAARFLHEKVPPLADIGVFEQPYALRYLSERRVRWMPSFERPLSDTERAALPRWLVLTPAVGAQLHFTGAGYAWFESDCRLAAQFDGFAIYQVEGDYPRDLRVLHRSKIARAQHPLAAERSEPQAFD